MSTEGPGGAVGQIAVLGGGTMGRGIARAAAQSGYEVVLRDLTDELVAAALAGVEAGCRQALSAGRLSQAEYDRLWDRLCGTTDLRQAVEAADLVIEAVPEDFGLKAATWREVLLHCPEDAILASNTSSLSVTKLGAASGKPERFVGMHFFNPVDRMPLIEIVRGKETSEETVRVASETGKSLGKTVIVVNDSPGFATTRLGVLLALEAMRMVEEGVAGAPEIDTAMELGYRHPMGPLKVTDLVGLDVRLAIAESLHRELGTEAFRPPELLRRMVADGKLGKKSGQGFYDWRAGKSD